MKSNVLICQIILIISLINNRVYCQDEDEEEEESEVSEEESTSSVNTKSEEVETTLNPLTRLAIRLRGANGTVDPAAVNALVKAALQKANRATTEEPTTTLDPLTNITKALQGGNNMTGTSEMGTVSPILLSMLVQAALLNRNRQAAIVAEQQQQALALAVTPAPVQQTTTAPPRLGPNDPDGLEYIMGQVNKIMASVVQGNVSGIIENSLQIRAPSSVQAAVVNILNFLTSWTGGIFGGGRPTTPRPSSTLQLRSCDASGPASPGLPTPPVPPSRAAAAGSIG